MNKATYYINAMRHNGYQSGIQKSVNEDGRDFDTEFATYHLDDRRNVFDLVFGASRGKIDLDPYTIFSLSQLDDGIRRAVIISMVRFEQTGLHFKYIDDTVNRAMRNARKEQQDVNA